MVRARDYTLTIWIFAGFILGIIAGTTIGKEVIPFAGTLAQIFLRLLRMAIMPLIITSIVSAVVQVGTAYGLGRIGLRTFGYYILTSLLAIFTGQVLVNIFKPGAGAEIGLQANPENIEIIDKGLVKYCSTLFLKILSGRWQTGMSFLLFFFRSFLVIS